MAFYSCPHIYINGRICGKTATGKKVVPFIGKCDHAFLVIVAECGSPTASKYGMCAQHAAKHRNKINYWKKRNVNKYRVRNKGKSYQSFRVLYKNILTDN